MYMEDVFTVMHATCTSLQSEGLPPQWCTSCMAFVYYRIYYNKECARTLLGGLLHAGCCNLEMVFWWISVYLDFPPLRTLVHYSIMEKGRSHVCIRLAVNQPEQKLGGVVAATEEARSLQSQYDRRCQPSRLTEVIFRSDWVTNYRPSCMSASLDITLAYSRSAHLLNYPSSMLAA